MQGVIYRGKLRKVKERFSLSALKFQPCGGKTKILDKKQHRKLSPLSGHCDVIAYSCRDAAAIWRWRLYTNVIKPVIIVKAKKIEGLRARTA